MMEVLVDAACRPEKVEPLPIEQLARFVMEQEECPQNAEVSVSFVDDVQMARLNEEFRGKPGPTDVLSFECDGADDEWDEWGLDDSDEGGPYLLGDVVIAPDVVQRQTEAFGTTFEGELSLLLVHGLLHLCGYDHIEDAEAQEMEAREASLLSEWAARRGLPMSAFGRLNGADGRVRGEH